MDKSLSKAKARKLSPESTKQPTITKATTKDKNQALQAIIGMWADRDEVSNIKAFREGLWRRKTS